MKTTNIKKKYIFFNIFVKGRIFFLQFLFYFFIFFNFCCSNSFFQLESTSTFKIPVGAVLWNPCGKVPVITSLQKGSGSVGPEMILQPILSKAEHEKAEREWADEATIFHKNHLKSHAANEVWSDYGLKFTKFLSFRLMSFYPTNCII